MRARRPRVRGQQEWGIPRWPQWRNDVGMNHSMKMMWACVIVALVAVILVASGLGGGYFLLLILCMIMMTVMMWMMRDIDGRHHKKG